MLSKTLGEAKKSKVDPLNLRRRKLTARDMQLTFPDEPDWLADVDIDGDGEIDGNELNRAVEQLPSMGGEVAGGEYIPSLGDMEEMANEMGMELDELPGYDPRRHTRQTPEERQVRSELRTGLAPYPSVSESWKQSSWPSQFWSTPSTSISCAPG